MRLIENPPPPGTRVVIVEDVVTSGRSALKAVDEVQKAGCIVAGVIALVDRDEGGAEAIRGQVPGYVALYSRRDFPQIASAGRRVRRRELSPQGLSGTAGRKPAVQRASPG